jgi:hypothetical protein
MKKWMYVVIGVVVVVGVVLAVRFAPERSPVENGIPDGGNGVPDNGVPDNGAPDIATATSLQFSVEWANDETGELTYSGKDMGTEDMKLRCEGTLDGVEEGFIINGELRKIWSLQDGVWRDEGIEDEYWDTFWDMFVTPFEAYAAELYDWTHGDWTYTEPYMGYSVRIYNIQVNPDLSDALFAP